MLLIDLSCHEKSNKPSWMRSTSSPATSPRLAPVSRNVAHMTRFSSVYMNFVSRLNWAWVNGLPSAVPATGRSTRSHTLIRSFCSLWAAFKAADSALWAGLAYDADSIGVPAGMVLGSLSRSFLSRGVDRTALWSQIGRAHV